MFSTAGLILAPAMLWGWVFYHSHRYKQTRLLLLLVLFAGGFLSGLLAPVSYTHLTLPTIVSV